MKYNVTISTFTNGGLMSVNSASMPTPQLNPASPPATPMRARGAIAPTSMSAAVSSFATSGGGSAGMFAAEAQDIATIIRPTPRRVINIVTVRASLAGSEAFINLIADSLDKAKYAEQIAKLKSLAGQYSPIEKTGTSTIDPAVMLANVSATAERLRKDLVAILLTVKTEDRKNLQKLLESKVKNENIPFPAFLKDIIRLVEYQEAFTKGIQEPSYYNDPSTEVNSLAYLWRGCEEAEFFPLILEWLKTIPFKDPKERQKQYVHTMGICVDISPDKTLAFLRQSGDLLSLDQKISLMSRIIDRYLKEENPIVWEFLMPKKAAQLPPGELEVAKKDFEEVKSLLKQNKVPQAFELANSHIFDLDSSTKALKFPDLCFEFFEQMLALSKEQLAQLDTPSKDAAPTAALQTEKDVKSSTESTGAAAQPAKPEDKKLGKPFMNVLEFMITYLPDNDRKKALMNQGAKNELLLPASSAFWGAFHQVKDRQRRLLDLAKIFIKNDEMKRAFEVVAEINQKEFPMYILAFIISILDTGITLIPEQNKAILSMIQNLPNPAKYFLILQNKEEQNPLLAQLEKEFDLPAFREEAEKQVCLFVTQVKIDSFLRRKGLKEDVIDKVYLFFSRLSNHERQSFLKSRVWKKKANDAVLQNLLNFHGAAGSVETMMMLLENSAPSQGLIDQIKAWNLHPYFKQQLVKLTQKAKAPFSAKFKKAACAAGISIDDTPSAAVSAIRAALEKEISEKDKKQLATADDDFQLLRSLSEKNPLLSAEDLKEVRSSDFILFSYVNVYMYNERAYIDSNVEGLLEQYIKKPLNAWTAQGIGVELR